MDHSINGVARISGVKRMPLQGIMVIHLVTQDNEAAAEMLTCRGKGQNISAYGLTPVGIAEAYTLGREINELQSRMPTLQDTGGVTKLEVTDGD